MSESDSDSCSSTVGSLSDSDIEMLENLCLEGPVGFAYEPRILKTTETENKQQVAATNPGPDHNPDPRPDRLQNTDWCQCGNCTVMATSRECKCCHDESEIDNKILSDTVCVTQNPSLYNICVDYDALLVAMLLNAYARVETLQRPINSV